MIMGILAIISMFNEQYSVASVLILLAVLFDRMDGGVARKLNVTSEFGKELDSLCDLISFGVAPSLLIWNLVLAQSGILGIATMLLFSLSGAIRLARYNITEFDGWYVGVPITMSGGLVALMALMTIRYDANITLVILTMLFLSYAMISKKIKLKKR